MYSLASRYCDAIQNAGGLPIIIPHSRSRTQIRHLLRRVDGLLISGGGFDIDPRHYGEQPIAKLGKINSQRTFTELESIALGFSEICRCLGSAAAHKRSMSPLEARFIKISRRSFPTHKSISRRRATIAYGHVIEVARGTLLHKIFNRQTMKVNTTHHQAIRNLGKGLAVNATAPDGLIEGIESKKHSFVLGLQWHPEVLARSVAVQRRIFSSFVLACRRLHCGI